MFLLVASSCVACPVVGCLGLRWQHFWAGVPSAAGPGQARGRDCAPQFWDWSLWGKLMEALVSQLPQGGFSLCCKGLPSKPWHWCGSPPWLDWGQPCPAALWGSWLFCAPPET